MNSIYKTPEGKKAVREACAALYARWPVPAEQRTLRLEEFGETCCIESGNPEGAPLVLLHGSSGNSASWMGCIPHWSGNFRILALDMPGHPGLSDEHPAIPLDGSLSRWLEQAVDALGLDRFFLCGMSLGGWAALNFAVHSPSRVRGLCLVTAGGVVPPRAGFFFRILPLLFLGTWGMKRINRLISGPVPMDREAEAFGLLAARNTRPVPMSYPLFADGELAAVKAPLLYLGGTGDVLLNTRETARRLLENVPGARIEILENYGHVIADQGERIGRFFSGLL